MKLKKVFNAACRYLSDPNYRFQIQANLGRYNKLDDEAFLRRMFYTIRGAEPDLANPKSFSEKLQWLKLHQRDPKLTMLVDKVAVRDHVARTIGSEYLIPLLGVWEDPLDIDFDGLPDQFVLKCNHNSGLGMCICKDKSRLERKKVIAGLKKGLAEDYYLKNREWPYKNVSRRVICEAFLSDGTGDLADYKIHCFHGEPKFILVCQNRFSASGLTEDFFTPDWQHMALKRPHLANAPKPVPRPAELDRMLALAAKLAGDLPFARVDFYTLAGKIYFGEITLFPASGFTPFEPACWDDIFGSWLHLS